MEIREQGDVIFLKIDSIPEGATRDDKFNGIVQFGEHTGHKHRLTGNETDMFHFFHEGRRYLQIKEEMKLLHEERKEVPVPPGFYEVRIVRELDWYSDLERPVVD
jgi:hypothetical protein